MPIYCMTSSEAIQSQAFYISWTRPQLTGILESSLQWRHLLMDLSLSPLSLQFSKLLINVQLMLCYLGVPMFGKTFLFGDNKSAKKSGSIPHSRLKKRHNALSYHFVREAANLIQFSHIPDDSNPADILGDTWMSGRCWNPFSFMKGTLPKSWKRMTGNLIRSLPRLRRRRCKDLILIQWIN